MTARLYLHEVRTQQRLFWRSYEAAFFTFLLPILFLVLIGSLYGDSTLDGIKGSTFLLAGMIGYSIAAGAFAGLAISVVIRRESGVLKRVRGTPLPPWIGLSAVITSTMIVIGLNVVIQLLIGRFALDAGMPQSVWSFILTLVVGVAAFAALGLAITTAVRSAEGSSAIVNAIYLPMVFLSGSFFSTESLPAVLDAISAVLPLTFALELLRDTFVSGETVADHPGDLVGLLLWGFFGLIVALRAFRWEPQEA
ncbi:MAG: ABC transporter permease [Gaiellales bacterium]